MCGSSGGDSGGNDEPERPVPIPQSPPTRPKYNPMSDAGRHGPPMAEVPVSKPVPTPTPKPQRPSRPSHQHHHSSDDSNDRRGPPMAEVPAAPDPKPVPVPTPPPDRPYRDRPMSHGPSTSMPSSVASHGYVTSESDGSVVRDSSGRPVMTVPVTPERSYEEIHRDSEPLLNNENLTPEEQEDENGRRYRGRKGGSDSRKTRLTILRTNPSVAVGTKKHRATRPTFVPTIGITR